MRSRTVMSSELAARGSWLPSDYIYALGEKVFYHHDDGLYRPAVVVRQDRNTVWLATVEYVPGSQVEFCCRVPTPVDYRRIKLRRAKPWPS